MSWEEIWFIDYGTRFNIEFLEMMNSNGSLDRDLLACKLGLCL